MKEGTSSIPNTAEGFYIGARLRAARLGSQLVGGVVTEKQLGKQVKAILTKQIAGFTGFSAATIIGVELGRTAPKQEIIQRYEDALHIAPGTLLRDHTPIRREDLDTERDTEDTGRGIPYLGEGIMKRPDGFRKQETIVNEDPEFNSNLLRLKQGEARGQLSDIFKEQLGYETVGQANSDNKLVTPFSIITQLRDQDPDITVTREKTLSDLVISLQISTADAIRIGVLWGEAYGSSGIEEVIDRFIDSHNLAPDERDVYERMLYDAAKAVLAEHEALQEITLSET